MSNETLKDGSTVRRTETLRQVKRREKKGKDQEEILTLPGERDSPLLITAVQIPVDAIKKNAMNQTDVLTTQARRRVRAPTETE